MQYTMVHLQKALQKAGKHLKISSSEMEQFKTVLRRLLDSLNPQESDEHSRNYLSEFLKSSFYVNYAVSTRGRADLVIHTGNSTRSKTGLLLLVKRPGNKAHMPSPENLNNKAVQELLLYYLQERVQVITKICATSS